MSQWWAPACQQYLVSSGFEDSSHTLLPAAQPRSLWCCSCPQCSCCLPVPGVATLSELLWAQEGPLWRQQSQTHLILLKMSHNTLLGWSNISLLSLSSDTLTAPALSVLRTGAAKGQLLPWKPHLVAFLSGFHPAAIQAFSRLHYKELINHSHKASTPECWLPTLMNAFSAATPVAFTPIQPHH